ncbi:hypothetical protein EJB05_49168 [Eragrostis curvula]|uniref:FBD domain-containing protein n=1 Tax=Eragrostis curvula TaxID=38414 RepID=A0A5J9T659_9POAL|nr:hypothetical protein EJB05_49168 [Eragrostis curvula]
MEATGLLGASEIEAAVTKIWIQPEPSNLVGPWLKNLLILYLRHIHGECELDWTTFFLEGAPLLKKIYIEVWDHTCWGYEENELTKDFMEKCEILYQKKTDISWETPDAVKHYSLKQLIIKGYQMEEKFNRYIKRVLKAAVNLELIILLDSGRCECCKFSPATRYPRTEEERILIKKQILEWACSPIKIGIGT